MQKQYHKLIHILTETRRKQGLTQFELAAKIGKPQSYIAKYEGMTRILDVIELMQLCKALKLRPSKLMVLVQ